MRKSWFVGLSMLALSASTAFIAACEGVVSDPPGMNPGGGGGGPPPPGSTGDVRIERRVWRLSPIHYRAELDRLFGDAVPAVDIPESAPDHHLTAIAASARVDIGNATRFTDAAQTVATWLTTHPDATRCTDYGTPACVDTLLGWLPAEAFRRPVSAAEIARYRTLFDGLSADYEYDYAFAGVVRALLLAPDFVYRTELGPDGTGVIARMTDYETATLLAFTFTDGGPDADLMAAAERGDLASPDGREMAARALMSESKPMWQRFFWEWLHMATLESQGAEVGLSTEIVGQIREEQDAFVGNVIVDEEGTLRALLSATHSWTRPELAAQYGAEHPGGTDLARVELDPTQRGGLLTRMAWLISHGKDGRDNVVRRGMGIFVDAMCHDIAPPPGLDLVAELARIVPPDATVRQVVEARGSDATCGACHHQPDPVGLVFESFASDGTWQTVYASDGLMVETEVDVPELGNFADASTLSLALADDEPFQQCLVRRLVHYMAGVDVGSPASVVWTGDALEAFRASGTSFEELAVAIVRHPAFIERRR